MKAPQAEPSSSESANPSMVRYAESSLGDGNRDSKEHSVV